jgi:thymidylate synthase
MEIIGETITQLYVKTLQALYDSPEKGSRLGTTKELLDPTLILKNPRTRRITEPIRRQSMSYVVNEIKWYLSGHYEVEEIAQRAKFWYEVADKLDHRVYSNYGAKLFHEKVRGYTQFERVLAEMQKSINSRRGVFFFSLYPIDYVWMSSAPDFVCTVYGHIILNHEGKLDLYVYMRSNDINWGWGNDVPFFTLIQEMFATKLHVPMGEYHHHSGSLHIYEKFYKKLEGRKYEYFNIAEETPFAPMCEQDVDDLIAQKYDSDSSFMKSFRKWDEVGVDAA